LGSLILYFGQLSQGTLMSILEHVDMGFERNNPYCFGGSAYMHIGKVYMLARDLR